MDTRDASAPPSTAAPGHPAPPPGPAPDAAPTPTSARSALLWSLAPLLVFYLVEDQWGTTAALVASMLFTVGDLGFTWWRRRTLDRVALFSGALVLLLGGLSLLSDDERFMLYTPIVSDAVMAAVLLVSIWRGRPLLLTLALAQQPELAGDPVRARFLRGMTARLAVNLVLHAGLTAWAVGESRETWLFVSGPLQYALLGAQFLLEMALGRWTLPPEP